MAVISDHNGKLYRPVSYEKEADFERAVVALADSIFGPGTIYVDVKKRVAGKGIVSIPDGYVIDMTKPDEPKLFVVENEIASHDPFRHIGIQMLKFVTSFEDAKPDVRNFLMEEITKNPGMVEKLENGCSESSKRNIDNYLDSAVYSSFHGLVIIDEARAELHHVLEKINANISVLELRTFSAEDGSTLHQFDTLYDEFEDQLPEKDARPQTADERKARRLRRAKADTIIVPAREEGFRKAFLGENQWYAIRIGAAMKDRIKYIAGYQIRPISAVTHIADVKEIRPYQDTGKYVVIFAGPAQEITQIPLGDPNRSPQGPVYAVRDELLRAKTLEEALA
jgi:hypothetical protein